MMTIRPAGDGAILVEWEDRIDPAINRRVLAAWRALRRESIPGVSDVVPSYRSLLVSFDPSVTEARRVETAVAERLSQGAGRPPHARGRRVTVPVLYGGPFGPDLEEVARHTGLSPGEVIRRHARGRYRVYMLGFMPGFAYLGGLDPALRTPRHDTPRLNVPGGSVGIGGAQTGIYPLDGLPGGWHLIGRTWVTLWDPARRSPALLRPGDTVRFEEVTVDLAPPGWVEQAGGNGALREGATA